MDIRQIILKDEVKILIQLKEKLQEFIKPFTRGHMVIEKDSQYNTFTKIKELD